MKGILGAMYPELVARFVREPFGYFLSREQKKYHSISRFGKKDFSASQRHDYYQYPKIPSSE
ncbi:hypothetical protein H5410_032770 [Solanum commersonii]|uniref:Uncharacterized protein n=1 Tax=Solanum commersonii TaxID=4109 RepID=A0A9J5YNV6_SOLCO|nr:hypothetical protein H5410_032770 [Solanum commersonii]